VLYETAEATRPLYVGVAARQTLRQRWMRQHLRPRAGGSALRRSLGVHLGFVPTKLRRPERYYPDDVEEAITSFLLNCWIELQPAVDAEAAERQESALIRQLAPALNVRRR
jgi:hypothetical protein